MVENNVVTVGINCEEDCEYYVTIKGQKVPCSREVYLTIKRPGRMQNKRDQRNKRPFINGKRCDGDCSCCIHCDGDGCAYAGEVSLDKMYEEAEHEVVAKENVEDSVVCKITVEQMYQTLEGEDDRLIQIFELMIAETKRRDIADTLGIAEGTVTYYIKKIREKLDKFNH